MGRESSKPPKNDEVKELAKELIYTPSLKERQLKAKFWSKAQENPLIDLTTSVTLAQVKQIAGGGSAMDKAWANPAFRNWFLDLEDGRARLEYLFDLGLDAMERLLISDDPKTSSAKVNALKLLMELTGRNRPAPNSGALASAIAGADKASLEALFESAGLSVSVSAKKDNTILITPEE